MVYGPLQNWRQNFKFIVTVTYLGSIKRQLFTIKNKHHGQGQHTMPGPELVAASPNSHDAGAKGRKLSAPVKQARQAPDKRHVLRASLVSPRDSVVASEPRRAMEQMAAVARRKHRPPGSALEQKPATDVLPTQMVDFSTTRLAT